MWGELRRNQQATPPAWHGACAIGTGTIVIGALGSGAGDYATEPAWRGSLAIA